MSWQSRLDEKLAELRSKEEKARAAASEELAARAAAQSQVSHKTKRRFLWLGFVIFMYFCLLFSLFVISFSLKLCILCLVLFDLKNAKICLSAPPC